VGRRGGNEKSVSKFIISDLRNISEVPMRVFCGHGAETSHVLKINIPCPS
jgi:hypothetical protein